jgi:hypothetical protein
MRGSIFCLPFTALSIDRSSKFLYKASSKTQFPWAQSTNWSNAHGDPEIKWLASTTIASGSPVMAAGSSG